MSEPERVQANRASDSPGQESLSMLAGELMAHLHRLRRPLSRGLLAILLATAALLASPLGSRYEGSATLATPVGARLNRSSADPGGPASDSSGLSIRDFRLFLRSLQDEDVLSEHFPGHPDVRQLSEKIPTLVAPLLAYDVAPGLPIPNDARVLGVEVWASGRTEALALGSLDQLGSTVRDVLVRVLENARVEEIRKDATERREGLHAKVRTALLERESFVKLGASLAEIPSASGANASARDVVDVAGGAHRFLPLPVQVNAARAGVAEADREIGLARAEIQELEALEAFMASLMTRVAGRAAGAKQSDLSALMAEEAAAFEARPVSLPPDTKAAVLSRVRGTIDSLRLQQSLITFAKKPSARHRLRYTVPLAFGFLAALTWLALVFLHDAWQTMRPRPNINAERDQDLR